MGTFYIDDVNKTVNFEFSYDKEISDILKSSHYNSRWNPEFKQWIVPVDNYSKPIILEVIEAYDFKQIPVPTEEDVNYTYDFSEVNYAYMQGLCDAKNFSYDPRDYQLEALSYALEKGSFINGFPPGAGKTFQSIMYAETTNSFPCLVIVPASVKYNWMEKWLEITSNKTDVAVIESKPTKKRPNNWNADVVVINYDIIGKKQGNGATVRFPELKSIDWKMVIFDEAHMLKNAKSNRSKAAKMIVKDIDKIQLLTGTAVMSKPSELWNLLLLCKKDHLISKSWKDYVYRYCGAYMGKFGMVTDGATKTMELNRKLRENCYIRKEKSEILSELPKVVKEKINVKVSNLKEIERATLDFISYIRETKGDGSADKAEEAEHLVMLGVMRKLSIEGKLKWIDRYIKDWKESSDEKLLIFGIHKEPLEFLANKYKSKMIVGGVSSKEKQRIVNEWKTNDDMFLFANMASGGTGIDGLQEVCSNMLITELPWRPSDLDQVYGRLDRSGQKNSVTIRFALSNDTVDKEMWSMLEDKQMVALAVNQGIDVRKSKSGMKAVIEKIMNKV